MYKAGTFNITYQRIVGLYGELGTNVNDSPRSLTFVAWGDNNLSFTSNFL